MKRFIQLFLCLTTLLLTSCATIINGTHQDVLFKSSVPAHLYVDGKLKGTTPVSVSLRRKEKVDIRLDKDGYIPVDYTLFSYTNNVLYLNMASAPLPIVAGAAVSPKEDPLLGILLGLYLVEVPPAILTGVDFITGAVYSYKDSCYFPMTKRPLKITDEKIIHFRCEKADFSLLPGDVIGYLKNSRGEKKNTLYWKNDLEVIPGTMTEVANRELSEMQYAQDSNSRYVLNADIDIIDYSKQEQRSDYTDLRCELDVKWKLIDKQRDTTLYVTETHGSAIQLAMGGDEVVKEAFSHALYNLLADNNFVSEISALAKVQ